jgi:hypothetical protein
LGKAMLRGEITLLSYFFVADSYCVSTSNVKRCSN